MRRLPPTTHPLASLLALSALTLLAACTSPTDAPSVDAAVQMAKGGGGGGPDVTGAVPSEGAQGSVNLQVRITGSGFDNQSNAVWLRNGEPAPDVQTNSTSYVSSSELIADITIDAAAVTALYDIEVTNRRGKKGVGVELFSVKEPGEVTPTYVLAFPDEPSAWEGVYISDISLTDVLAGTMNGAPALFDLDGSATILPDLGLDAFIQGISAEAHFAAGLDTEEGTWIQRGIVWDLDAGTANRAEPLAGYPFGPFSYVIYGVNDGGLAVGTLSDTNSTGDTRVPLAWEPDGSGRWIPRVLPLLPGFTRGSPLAVNDDGDIVGRNQMEEFSSGHAVLWSRNDDGTYSVTDLTPLADGTGDVIAFVVTERAPDGTVRVGGNSEYTDIPRATLWTVDAVSRTLLEELRAPTSGSVRRRPSPSGEVFIGRNGVWDPGRNEIIAVEPLSNACNPSPRAFDSQGRLWGRTDIGTKNQSSCVNDRWSTQIVALWTKVGG
ncbi:MAG: hypothetical protein R3253_04670 [Longimicrobiales bacterium]|nr:hypothetical protein [Longimicrobiales bacterium]